MYGGKKIYIARPYTTRKQVKINDANNANVYYTFSKNGSSIDNYTEPTYFKAGEKITVTKYEDVEINVGDNVDGFFVELWAGAPELFEVAIFSPTGEEMPRVPFRERRTVTYDFIFEQTRLYSLFFLQQL